MDDGFQESLVYSDSDNSDVDESDKQTTKEPSPEPQTPNDCLSPNKDSGEVQSHSSAESDEEDLNKSIKKTKKNARVLSSDDEEGENGKDNDNEPNSDGKDVQSEADDPPQPKVSMRPSICDSDTKSSSDGSEKMVSPVTISKKVKKKKKNELRKRLINDESESESNDDENEQEHSKKVKKSSKRKSLSDQSGSGESTKSDSDSSSSSNSSNHSTNQSNGNIDVKPREKTAQRMSAKQAEEQMKEIQSESQRMARQMAISVPYHRPKQHSLKEFLSRRSIVEQQERLKSKQLPKAAVAIKMSGDELIQFMEDMKKRSQEAEEFFQEEEEEDQPNATALKSDDSEDEDWVDKSKANESKPTEDDTKETPEPIEHDLTEFQIMEIDAIPSQSDICHAEDAPECIDAVNNENEDKLTNENENEDKIPNENDCSEPIEMDSTPLPKASNVIKFHTERTALDDELDGILPKEMRPKLSIPSDHVPKLKGDKGFVIDFDTNDIKPMQTTGVDELLNRFMKNACVKKTGAESQDIGIFQSDTGTVERHKFHVHLDDTPKRETKPGESLFKLRSELGQKIKENREKLIAQRLQEEKEQELSRKKMEEEDEEFCEDIDEEEVEDEEDEEELADNETDETKIAKSMVESEAMECEQTEEDAESEDENSAESESEALDNEVDVSETTKPRKRILTLDDDSDDDEPQQIESKTDDQVPSTKTIEAAGEIVTVNQSLDDSIKTIGSHDLSALESEILQLNTQANSELNKSEMNRTETSKLFEDDKNEYGEIGESQLMELCSGSFATQFPEKTVITNVQPTQNTATKEVSTQKPAVEVVSSSKPAFLSSDEEEIDKDENSMKVKKKRKKQTLIYSDDEEEEDQNEAFEEEDEVAQEEEDEEQVEDEEEDVGERYIEYDSDENEVEVELKKSDVRKKASEYFEQEAELSGDELGSADEDEKDEMNRYEAELGDADKFDKNKLRDELERIRLREQIDDDARELRILTERFIEEEDNGQERERKFRWKHLNNGDNDDQVPSTDQDAETMLNNSDDENEAEWRRIRYEREQLLKQQMKDGQMVVEETSVAVQITEQQTVENGTTSLNSDLRKRISFVKTIASSKISSPFLITKTDLSVGHLSRNSFLNRDSPILEKLASMTKLGSNGDVILNTAKGKGNYTFVATEKKDNPKRKSESEAGAMASNIMNPSKKSKMDPQNDIKLKPKTKVFLESLN